MYPTIVPKAVTLRRVEHFGGTQAPIGNVLYVPKAVTLRRVEHLYFTGDVVGMNPCQKQ